MVPFYGQGMNAGFEDCFILNNILDQNADNIALSVEQFTRDRREDAHSICELAMYNYTEMRDLVRRHSYQIRKQIDDVLYLLVPKIWIPLYTSVTFTNMGYKKCMKNRKWQDRVGDETVLFTKQLRFLTMIQFAQKLTCP